MVRKEKRRLNAPYFAFAEKKSRLSYGSVDAGTEKEVSYLNIGVAIKTRLTA